MTPGVYALETTDQKASTWIGEIMQELRWNDRHAAYLALRAVLQTLRVRLTADEGADFGSRLPPLIRDFYFESWRPTLTPIKYDTQEFLTHVGSYFAGQTYIDPEPIVRAVFKVISRRIDCGEISDIRGNLPGGILALWSPG